MSLTLFKRSVAVVICLGMLALVAVSEASPTFHPLHPESAITH
jgi:hypothetical protein